MTIAQIWGYRDIKQTNHGNMGLHVSSKTTMWGKTGTATNITHPASYKPKTRDRRKWENSQNYESSLLRLPILRKRGESFMLGWQRNRWQGVPHPCCFCSLTFLGIASTKKIWNWPHSQIRGRSLITINPFAPCVIFTLLEHKHFPCHCTVCKGSLVGSQVKIPQFCSPFSYCRWFKLGPIKLLSICWGPNVLMLFSIFEFIYIRNRSVVMDDFGQRLRSY